MTRTRKHRLRRKRHREFTWEQLCTLNRHQAVAWLIDMEEMWWSYLRHLTDGGGRMFRHDGQQVFTGWHR